MNRGRFIGGAICVAIAVLLAVLAVVLPDEDMLFQVGDQNIPFLPSIILGIVGAALILTSGASSAGAQGGAQGVGGTAPGPAGSEPAGTSPYEAATYSQGGEGTPGAPDEDTQELSEKIQSNKQLERMGWGAFLIMLGGFALVPDRVVPRGLWSIGLGLIWLGLNAARYNKGIKMSGFTTFLGVVLLVSGTLELVGLEEVGGAIFLITLGVYVILKPAIARRGLFGKAEEG